MFGKRGKLELRSVGGGVAWCSRGGSSVTAHQRPKKRITLWSSNPTSGEEFPRELKVGSWRANYIPMFIVGLFHNSQRVGGNSSVQPQMKD